MRQYSFTLVLFIFNLSVTSGQINLENSYSHFTSFSVSGKAPITCLTQLGVDIDGEAAGDVSGFSVSMNALGDRVAIGAPSNDGAGTSAGHVRIYAYNGQLGADIDGEAGGDGSGYSVSMNATGDRVAIGAPWNNGTGSDAGHTRIYAYNGTAWTQLGADIDGEAAGDESGYSVSMNDAGDRVAIGARFNDGTGSDAGHVRIYAYNGTAWIQLGADIDGEKTWDWSGRSVSMNATGDRVAIGAHFNDGTGSDAGHVRIYAYNGTAWTQLGADIDGEAAGDWSGTSVSMNATGDRVAIGAVGNNGTGSDAGHTRIYAYNGSAWTQLGADIDGEAAWDWSGYSVSINATGDLVAIGAIDNAGTGTIVAQQGHVRIYAYNGTAWIQWGLDIDGEAAGDLSGTSVSMNEIGDRVAIGARFNDGAGSSAGHTRIYSVGLDSTYSTYYRDMDGDLFGNLAIDSISFSCIQPMGYVLDSTDCNDADTNLTVSGASCDDGDVNTTNDTVTAACACLGTALPPHPYPITCITQLGANIDGEAAGDYSGISVSMNATSDRVAIGASNNDGASSYAGHVRIYAYNDTAWTQLGADIDGEAFGDQSGRSVSMNATGDRVAIGAKWNHGAGSGAGHVRIYAYNDTAWTQLGADIDGEAVGDLSGGFVSMNATGDRVAIGAAGNDGAGTNAGHVRIYAYNDTAWTQLGADIDGEAAGDRSGGSVSMNATGDRVAIGAIWNDGAGSDAGHVRIYAYNDTAWTQLGADIDGEAVGDRSGFSVSMNATGDRVAIGASDNDGAGSGAGHVRIYAYNDTAWTQLGADIDGEAVGDHSGSVSMNATGDRVAIGAIWNDGTDTSAGHVRIYAYNDTAWTQLGADIDGEASGDFSGESVSMNATGDRVAIGASDNDGAGSDAGHVRIFSIGLARTYYHDMDGDLFGNLAIDSISCTQPIGYVLDSTDCNDADTNLTVIGASCDDGDVNTTNDTVTSICVCVGMPITPGIYSLGELEITISSLTTGFVSIKANHKVNASIKVYTVQGKLVQAESMNTNTKELNLTNLKSAYYFVTIEGNDFRINEKVLITK